MLTSDRSLSSLAGSREVLGALRESDNPSDFIAEVIDRLVIDLSRLNERLLTAYPAERYLEYLDAYPEVGCYTYVSAAVKGLHGTIRGIVGEKGLERYHQLVMLRLILRSAQRLKTADVPDDVRSFIADNFARIVRNIARDRDPPGFYLYPSISKELAICRLHLVPAGAQKVCLHGFSRRALLACEPSSGLLRARKLAAFVLGGSRRLYEMHTDSRDPRAMALFTPAGWIRFYKLVADLLRRDPRVNGVFGSSWFFDPVLERVSPELAYLRTLVTDHGGWLFRLGACDRASTEDAIRFSPQRRGLFERGEYAPMKHLVVWPRDELISWSERT